jgi:predicted nucleic acid-binding Zn ribbon protein
LQSSAAKNLSRCPTCRSKVTKLVSASSFHLKGGGWYADGYQKGAVAKAAGESKPADSSSSKSETKSGSETSKDSAKSTSSSTDN